jgi:eukaryotic-like serine/threonine-protein kinase
MNADYQLQTGQIFARYQIVRTIGEGGMGTVYEAFHPALKKRFAIKTLLPAIAQTPEFRTRFLREAEVAARINHPNIVRVTDVGTEGDTPYMVMEYLEGNTLGHLLAERGRLDFVESADILLPVLSAVAAGHAAGIIHRDLKPENIFLTQGAWGDLVPKVLDFGVSKLMTEEPSGALTGTLTVLGTAAYMSPEQARGARQVTHLSDQYALGLILYEMLTGTRGHPGDNPFEILFNISNLAIIPLLDVRPDCPPELEKVVMRMLAPEPENRYRSLLDVGAALLPFASDRSRLTVGDSFRQGSTGEIVPLADSSVPVRASRPLAARSSRLQPGSTPTPLPVRMPLVTGSPQFRGGDETTDLLPRRLGRGALVVGALAGAALLGGVFSLVLRRPPPPAPAPSKAALQPEAAVERPKPAAPPPRHVDLTTIPAEAGVSIDNGSPWTGQLHTTIPADGESHVIRVWAEGYEPRTISFGPDETPPAQIRLDPLPRPTASGKKPKTKIFPHQPVRTQTDVEPPDEGPRDPKRGANDAFILE